MKGLIFICFALYLPELVSADYIPVIIWGPHVQHESAVAWESYCGNEFLDILRKHSTVDTITFIIAEDQLSVEDLSACKASNGQTCFKGMQSVETKLYLPSVEDPLSVIDDVTEEEADMNEINLISSGNFSELLTNRTEKYFFVNFGDGNHINETISEKLTRHDQMITKFYKLVSQNDRQIVVVFTGKQDARRTRFSREASMSFTYFEAINSTDSTKSGDGYVWKTEPILLYYTSIGIETSNESMWMNVKNMTVEATDKSKRNEKDHTRVEENREMTNSSTETETNAGTNANIAHTATHLIVTISVNVDDIFKFVITTANGNWLANQFTWNEEPIVSNRPISAPNSFSYHCSPSITLNFRNRTASGENRTIAGQNVTEFVITWKGLQLQPKFVYVEGEQLSAFSDAYDCVGFLTPVILSGLLVGFMLLFILFIGIIYIMNIKPVERFDNSNGPRMTFTVIE